MWIVKVRQIGRRSINPPCAPAINAPLIKMVYVKERNQDSEAIRRICQGPTCRPACFSRLFLTDWPDSSWITECTADVCKHAAVHQRRPRWQGLQTTLLACRKGIRGVSQQPTRNDRQLYPPFPESAAGALRGNGIISNSEPSLKLRDVTRSRAYGGPSGNLLSSGRVSGVEI